MAREPKTLMRRLKKGLPAVPVPQPPAVAPAAAPERPPERPPPAAAPPAEKYPVSDGRDRDRERERDREPYPQRLTALQFADLASGSHHSAFRGLQSYRSIGSTCCFPFLLAKIGSLWHGA